MSDAHATPTTGSDFHPTHWSSIIAAGDPTSPHARQALERLCRAYWRPLYSFARRQGRDPHNAEDITQSFFAKLIEKNYVAEADPARGRFRTFLLASFKHFLANDWHHGQRQKRGSGGEVISLDGDDEGGCRPGVEDAVTPETLYERQWAETLLERVLSRLRAEYAAEGKGDLFEELRDFLAERIATPHAEIAARHGVSVGAVSVAIHRLRQRYGNLLRDEIGQTVSRPEDAEDEIRHLITVVGR